MLNKRCRRCNVIYPATTEYFHKCINEIDGLRYICKKCRKEDSKKYYIANRTSEIEKSKNHYKTHVADKKKYNAEYRKNNICEILSAKKIYYKNNCETLNINSRQYYLKNKDSILKHNLAYYNNKRRTNNEFRLLCNLRKRLWDALNSNKTKKTLRTKELLGCSISKLKQHLQSKFKDGMNWDNYGQWHIDHIKPCCSFDLTKENNQKECFHYTNLQPLWWYDNLKKGKQVISI